MELALFIVGVIGFVIIIMLKRRSDTSLASRWMYGFSFMCAVEALRVVFMEFKFTPPNVPAETPMISIAVWNFAVGIRALVICLMSIGSGVVGALLAIEKNTRSRETLSNSLET